MAKYEVCDRCSERIDLKPFKSAKVKRKIKWNCFGIMVEKEYDLCQKCSFELDMFLNPKKT